MCEMQFVCLLALINCSLGLRAARWQ